MKKLTQEQIDIILKQPYISSTKLSEQINIPASTIRSIRNKNGIKIKKIFDPDKEKLIQTYFETGSSHKTGEIFGVCHKEVLDKLHEYGIDTSVKKLLSDEEEDCIAKLYNTVPTTYLSEKYNVSVSKIHSIWSKHDLRGKVKRRYNFEHENFFESVDSSEKAYFLGWIASDGCLYEPHDATKQKILRICIQQRDEKILKLFQSVLGTDKPISSYVKSGKNYSVLEISSSKIVDDIGRLGLSPRKTYGNCIPDIPERFMFHFIRGYIDGDGTIPKIASNGVSIAGFYKNLSKIKDFLSSKNIFAEFVRDKRKYGNDDDLFGTLITTNKLSKYALIRSMYEDCGNFYLDRKYEIAQKYIEDIDKSELIRDKQIQIYYKYAVRGVS